MRIAEGTGRHPWNMGERVCSNHRIGNKTLVPHLAQMVSQGSDPTHQWELKLEAFYCRYRRSDGGKRGDECTPAKFAPASRRTRTKPWDCKLKLSCVHAGWKKVVAKNYGRLGSFLAISGWFLPGNAAGLHTPLPCVILSFMLFRFILIQSFLPWLKRLFFHV